MKEYSFRIRINLPKRSHINIERQTITFSTNYGRELILTSGIPAQTIKEAKQLIARSNGFSSKEEAKLAGENLRGILTRTLSKFAIGALFGERSGIGGYFEFALQRMSKEAGRKILDDVHGLMVFENEPNLAFAKVGDMDIARGASKERFVKTLEFSLLNIEALGEQDQTAYEIFSTSFFLSSVDARFLMLAMALEILINQPDRPRQITNYMNDFIEIIRADNDIPENEMASVVSGLEYLKRESVGQAGRKLVHEKLGEREYMDMSARKFFSFCYDIRSDLIHGNIPLPNRTLVGNAAANLETMVADILSGPLLDFDS